MDWTTGRSRFDPRQRQEDFSCSFCVQNGSGAHPAYYPTGTGGPFLGGKARPGRDADLSPHLELRSWMSRSYNSSPTEPPYVCSGTDLPLPWRLYQPLKSPLTPLGRPRVLFRMSLTWMEGIPVFWHPWTGHPAGMYRLLGVLHVLAWAKISLSIFVCCGDTKPED
jgi:hypothetical protein